ncbi:hypothetical protein Tco_0636065 [Tanacetum coccineum]
MNDMIRNRNALKQKIDSLKQTLSKQVKEKESLLQTFTIFKKESKEKENKYMDKEIDLEKKIKELDNIVYKVGQSAQTVHMLTKPQVFYDDTHKQALGYQNQFYLKKAQRIKPTLYDGVVISKKHDVIYVVDEEVVKVRTTPDAITEGSWGFEHTKKVFLEEVIPFINSLRASFKYFDNGLHSELNEVKTVFNQMKAAVEQSKLNAKDVSIANLRKHIKNLKGKNVVKKDLPPNNAKVIAPGMFKLDLEPLSPKVLKNKDAHIDYIKNSQEHAETLREIVEYARAL